MSPDSSTPEVKPDFDLGEVAKKMRKMGLEYPISEIQNAIRAARKHLAGEQGVIDPSLQSKTPKPPEGTPKK